MTATKADELAVRLLALHTGIDIPSAGIMWAGPDLLAAAKVALDTLRAWNAVHCHDLDDAQQAAMIEVYEQSPEIRGLVEAIDKAEGWKS